VTLKKRSGVDGLSKQRNYFGYATQKKYGIKHINRKSCGGLYAEVYVAINDTGKIAPLNAKR
jgi:hypothetical protein